MNRFLSAVEKKKLFKLVLGAGNESVKDVKDLISVYSQAGADVFDLNPSKEILDAAFCAVENLGMPATKFFWCVSIALKGDKHSFKAEVIQEKCVKCLKCIEKCPLGAVFLNDKIIIDMKKCIGCQRCAAPCIKFTGKAADLKTILAVIKSYPVDIVELHISTADKADILRQWEVLADNFKGILSICTDRAHFSDNELKELLFGMIKTAGKHRVIIQADGNPMSGGKDDFSSTLQAVACAGLLEKLGVPVFISGGTNSKTSALAKMCNVNYNGIAVGSFARKAVKPHLDKQLADVKSAVDAAKKLVNSVNIE